MRTPFLAITCWLTACFAAETTGPSAAERSYAKGDYAAAVEQWQQEIHSQGVTAGLLGAVGNAEWKLGRKGRAMICWERALLLDPRDTVALAGIRHAQNAGGTERPAMTWAETFSTAVGADTWLIVAAASFWVALLTVIIPKMRRKPANDWTQRARLSAVTLLALCIPGLWGARSYASRAVVRKTEVSLRLTPTLLGEPLHGVAEGDVVRTGRPFNGHIRITTADGKTGWVRAGEIESVWGGGLPADLDQKAAP
jgi:hypothetical protein